MFRLKTVAVIALLLGVSPAVAQQTIRPDDIDERLARARRVDAWPQVIQDSLVPPQWLSRGDRLVFWDAAGPAKGNWVLVDAARKTRAPIGAASNLREQLTAFLGEDLPLSLQMPFVLTPDDRGLLFRHAGAGFRIDLTSSRVQRLTDNTIEALLLNGALASPSNDRVVAVRENGFAVIDAAGRTQIARSDTADVTWEVPEHRWSPDGRLAVWRIDQRTVHRIPIVDYTDAVERVTMVPYAKVGTPIAKAQLYIFDPAKHTLTPVGLAEEEGYRWLAGWRGDGAALVLHLARDGKQLDLFAVSKAGHVTRILREERRDTKVADLNFATDGWRTQVTPLTRGRGFLWMSERDGWRHVYHYDEQGRLLRQVTKGAFPIVRIDRAAEDGTLLLTATTDPAAPYDERLYRVAMTGGPLHPIATELGMHMAIASPSGRYLIDSHSSWTAPRARDLRRSDGTIEMRLTSADASAVAITGRTPPEAFDVLAADGRTRLFGALHRPFAFDPAQRYPVIAYIYGGPFGTVVSRTFTGSTMTRSAETLAAAGFVVIAIDVRGSANRSKRFGDATYGRIGRSEISDYVTGLRQLGARRPWMDLSRVGIHGHSWGGYFAIRAMLTAPEMFKAGYAAAPGALDEDALVNEPVMGLHSANPAGYENASNLALAERLAGPLRIMHGTADINAPLSSSMRIVDALIQANKPVEFLAMPGVDHNPEGAARAYYRDDVIRFFTRTLAAQQARLK